MLQLTFSMPRPGILVFEIRQKGVSFAVIFSPWLHRLFHDSDALIGSDTPHYRTEIIFDDFLVIQTESNPGAFRVILVIMAITIAESPVDSLDVHLSEGLFVPLYDCVSTIV